MLGELRRLMRRIACALVALVSLGVGGCDSEPPEYPVPAVYLRFIPERSSIGPEGGPIFALLEFSASSGTVPQPLVVAVRAINASVDSLPGATRCAPGSATGMDGGTSASTRAGDVLLPNRAFKDNDGGLLETGLLVTVSDGTEDAVLEAAVYKVADDSPCTIDLESRLLALSNLRITRDPEPTPDAEVEPDRDSDAGASDAAEP